MQPQLMLCASWAGLLPRSPSPAVGRLARWLLRNPEHRPQPHAAHEGRSVSLLAAATMQRPLGLCCRRRCRPPPGHARRPPTPACVRSVGAGPHTLCALATACRSAGGGLASTWQLSLVTVAHAVQRCCKAGEAPRWPRLPRSPATACCASQATDASCSTRWPGVLTWPSRHTREGSGRSRCRPRKRRHDLALECLVRRGCACCGCGVLQCGAAVAAAV